MNLQQLRDQRQKVLAELKAITEAAKLGNRGFTDDERKRLKELQAEDDRLQASIKQGEEDQAFIQSTETRLATAVPTKTTRDDVPAPPKPQISVKDPNFLDDPKKGFRNHNEFLTGVMDAAVRKGTSDPRLRALAASNFQQLAAGSDEHGTYSDPYGGFFVPTAFSPVVLSVPSEADPLGGMPTQIPMDSPQVKILARVDKNHASSVSGGLRVYRRVETDTTAASRMEHEKIELNAASLFGVAYATEELLERSPTSFVALLQAGFSDEFAFQLLRERLFGTGVGEFEGIMTSAALVSISKESGQSGNTIVYENIIKMRARCWRYGSAVWLYNHDCLPQLMLLQHTIGTGGVPVWQPNAREGEPELLLGRPAYASECCKTLGTTGDLILANPSQYLEGTYRPMRSEESMHVRFLEHERTMKFWVENAGRCWWRSALTPNQGSNTLSPFVALATRA